MPSTYSSLKIELIPTGAQSGVWGVTTNANLGTAMEQAIVGTATCVTADFTTNVATYTLTDTNALQTARAFVLNVTATLTAAGTINVPAIQKPYLVFNNSVGGFAVTVKVSGQTGVSIPNGSKAWLYNNGTDVGVAFNYAPSLTLGAPLPIASGGTGATSLSGLTVGTATNLAGGAANRIAYQTGAGVTNFAPAPTTASFVLSWNGTTIDWASVPSVTSAGNLTGGGAYTVVYQTSVGVTAYVTNGTTGQVLTAATGGAPTWTTINALPSQTGNAGKYLSTDGTNASWENTGASAAGVIWENTLIIAANYTLTTSKNGFSVGPITINSGVVVTIPSGQRWVVL